MNVLLICIFTVRPGQDNIAQLQLADTPKRMGLLGKFIRDILCRWLHFFTKTASNLDFAINIALVPVRHLRLSVLH